jgi:hypothetical protein
MNSLRFSGRNGIRRWRNQLVVGSLCVAVVLAFLVGAASGTAGPLGSVSGLPGATGLAVRPDTGDLYVKSGISGLVWRVPVGSNGSLGPAEAISSDLGTAEHLAFDLAGNLYGLLPGGQLYSLYLLRLPPMSMVSQATNLNFDGFVPFNIKLGSAFAIESPGGTTSRLFFTVDPPGVYAFALGNFKAGGSTTTEAVNSCGPIRSLAYRTRFADLIATLPDAVVSIPISGNACSLVPGGSGFVSLQGIAWDNSGQRIFVADGATGELSVIYADGTTAILASDLVSPADVAYDAGRVFVAEPPAGRVSAFSADPPPTPVRTPTFSPTVPPSPSFTPVGDTATPTSTDTMVPTETAVPTLGCLDPGICVESLPPLSNAAHVTVAGSLSELGWDVDVLRRGPDGLYRAGYCARPARDSVGRFATTCTLAVDAENYFEVTASRGDCTSAAVDHDCNGGVLVVRQVPFVPTVTVTRTVTPTPEPMKVPCLGDCNGDRRVTIDELVLAVHMALDPGSGGCAAIDRDRNGSVSIDEIIAAVGTALGGCIHA